MYQIVPKFLSGQLRNHLDILNIGSVANSGFSEYSSFYSLVLIAVEFVYLSPKAKSITLARLDVQNAFEKRPFSVADTIPTYSGLRYKSYQ